MGKMITIKTSTFPEELAVAKTFLEENGIKCLLNDEYLAQITSKGFQLEVAEEDAEKALSLLIEGGFATIDEYKDAPDALTSFVGKIISKLTGDK